MQANGSKCPLDTDTDTDTDYDYDYDYDNEKGVWGKNERAHAREETHPHSHWARDRKTQVLSLFLHIFHKFIHTSTLLITKALSRFSHI